MERLPVETVGKELEMDEGRRRSKEPDRGELVENGGGRLRAEVAAVEGQGMRGVEPEESGHQPIGTERRVGEGPPRRILEAGSRGRKEKAVDAEALGAEGDLAPSDNGHGLEKGEQPVRAGADRRVGMGAVEGGGLGRQAEGD
jgi:hypothetical protein